MQFRRYPECKAAERAQRILGSIGGVGVETC